MTRRELLDAAMEQMATDLACRPEDFRSEANTIVEYRRLPGRRLFSDDDFFLKVASFGHGAVVSADRRLHPWCRDFFAAHRGIDCFEHPLMCEIDRALLPYGQMLRVVHELYLPEPCGAATSAKPMPGLRWFEGVAMGELYRHPGFSNALQYRHDAPRPDVLAAAVFDGDAPVAVAGASRDCERLWQIGVDVVPGWRGQGLASALVAALGTGILARGAIPYYGTWSANIASRLVARSCGYVPAWVEMYSVPLA